MLERTLTRGRGLQPIEFGRWGPLGQIPGSVERVLVCPGRQRLTLVSVCRTHTLSHLCRVFTLESIGQFRYSNKITKSKSSLKPPLINSSKK